MIESTKPVTDTEDEPEILARYTKVLPKGRCGCHHQLKADLPAEIEHSSEGWADTVEVECLFDYGWGGTEEEAIGDLVCSLGEYRLSLMDYRKELGGCSERCLELLEDMVS